MKTFLELFKDNWPKHSKCEVPFITYWDKSLSREVTLSYKAWAEETLKIAKSIQTLNPQNYTSRILLICENSPYWDIIEKAGFLTGQSVGGLSINSTLSEITESLNIVKPKIVISDQNEILEQLAHLYPSTKLIFLSTESQKVKLSSFPNFEDLTLTSNFHSDNFASYLESLSVSSATEAAFTFTSGTTGQKKSYTFSQSQLMLALREIIKSVNSNQNDKTVCWLPQSGLFQRMINTVCYSVGASIYFTKDPKEIIETLSNINPTVFVAVPRFYEKIVQQTKKTRIYRACHYIDKFLYRLLKLDYFERQLNKSIVKKVFGSNIQMLLSGSAKCSKETVQFFSKSGTPIFEAYGLSECIIPIAMSTKVEHKEGSVGKPNPINQLSLTTEGIVTISGPGLYAAMLTEEGEKNPPQKLVTSDIGKISEDGYLYLDGRADEIVKTSTGNKVSCVELSELFSRLPEVEYCLAVANNLPWPSIIISCPDQSDFKLEKLKNSILLENQLLPPAKRVRGALIIPRPLILKQEVTENFKLRRSAIETKFAEEIERLYRSSNPDQPINILTSKL